MWNEGLEGPALDIAGSDVNRLLVDAGPGAGKTFALMRRVCRLLEDEGVAPEKIFVGTFTRTSATDLKAELTKLGSDGVEAVYAGTLHAFCFGLLSRDDVFEQTQRIPRPLLKFEERFLLEDLRGDGFGGIKAKRERLEAFNTQWARLQTDDPGWLRDSNKTAFGKPGAVHKTVAKIKHWMCQLLPQCWIRFRQNMKHYKRLRAPPSQSSRSAIAVPTAKLPSFAALRKFWPISLYATVRTLR